VLCLAAFNLTFRLGREFVTEWDESLYAVSAWETAQHGNWIGTTFMGALDYYNTKPPLNIWLIALAFKTFGAGLISLRAASAIAAFLTVLVLLLWTKRVFGPLVALLSSLVLSTTFGFFYVHSGRSANTDALFTLFVLLTVVTLWAEARRPWMRVWFGALMAAVFLLRGMAFLLPLALVLVVIFTRHRREKVVWLPTLAAVALFLLPVSAWAFGRYRIDEWRFFERMFMFDFVSRSIETLEGHSGGPLYYLKILQKHHYDWLLVALVAWLLYPASRPQLRGFFSAERDPDGLRRLLVAWGATTLLVPTLMSTKTPWYLNPFYPLFALCVGIVVARSLTLSAAAVAPRRRLYALSTVVVLMLGLAEAKMIWYSFKFRDVSLSEQGLLLAERQQLSGRRICRNRHSRAGIFVATAVVGAQTIQTEDLADFLRDSRPGDYLLCNNPSDSPQLHLVRTNGRYFLYRRRGNGTRLEQRHELRPFDQRIDAQLGR
jgi:4-amino-4-deoxy-L-arabinose transferase-like glycosyltransferase